MFCIAPEDYTEVTMPLTFSQSNIRGEIAVRIQLDTLDEEDETFRAVLSVDSDENSVQVIPAEATVTIIDDDSMLFRIMEGLEITFSISKLLPTSLSIITCSNYFM